MLPLVSLLCSMFHEGPLDINGGLQRVWPENLVLTYAGLPVRCTAQLYLICADPDMH